jgi:hypothetical protein
MSASGGFGGRTYSADGRTIRVEPKEISKADGRTNIALGFPFSTLEEYVEPESVSEQLAEYLSCPKRAAAPELYEATMAFVACYPPALQVADERALEEAGCDPVEAALLANAVRALAKARGEQ